jgi:pilus assembly protein CpaD
MTVSPDCGNWRDNAGRNDENIPYDNFGCASQRNLAAMIARPSDAVYATPEVPRQGDKKSTDYSGFIKPVPVNPTSQSGVR